LEGKKIGIEEDTAVLNIATYRELTGGFKAEFVNASKVVKEGMAIKSPQEIACIRKAARITEKGMAAAIAAIREGATDNDVAQAAYATMIGAGSEYFSSQPYVTSGMRSGIPHTTFCRIPLKKGDSVLLEMSGVVNRYHAPMMRCAFVGEPTPRALEIFNGCKVALENVLNSLAPGKTCDEIARAGKQGIALIQEPILFHHTYGYSIGVGFPPTWADNSDLRILEGESTRLRPGMVFHHTMSVRDPGKYGICVSETTVITESGCEVMGNFDRKLFAIH
jgi:Xaa-Pro dipeptidase